MVTSGHVTKMVVTTFDFDLPYPKTPRCMHSSWLYVLDDYFSFEFVNNRANGTGIDNLRVLTISML